MTDNERIESVLNYLNMRANKFAKHIGLKSPQILYDILNGRNGISKYLADKITAKCVNISLSWLLTGEGEMISTQVKTHEYYGGENYESVNYVPLLPISAQGGTLNDFIVSMKDSECERVVSPIRGADFAMTVAGDSMSPEYPSGSQILIKKINEKAFIDWGKVYVLDTCNGSVIKRIFPSDNDESRVKCVSINPAYPPFEVYLGDVYGIYRVLLCMSVK